MSDLVERMAAAIPLSRRELIKVIRSAPKRYKVYKIPKRTPGEFRTIAQPAREVKNLQYWVMRQILSKLPIHNAATAYRCGKSIADNARPHASGKYLLKLDFKDFFPSIKARDFDMYVRQKGPQYSAEDVETLCNILFWRPTATDELCLSIGAPSSPALSNVLLWDFDCKVAAFCQQRSVSYTRYADDTSFSAEDSSVLGQVECAVHSICTSMSSPLLELNTRKTVRVSKNECRRVTGLVLTNDAGISLGHEPKRIIRARVHHYTLGQLSSEECKQLRGTLAFVNAVEPSYLDRLRDKYGADVISELQRA